LNLAIVTEIFATAGRNRRKRLLSSALSFHLCLPVSVLFPPVSLRRRQGACPQLPLFDPLGLFTMLDRVCLVAAKQLWAHDTVRTPGGSSILTYLFGDNVRCRRYFRHPFPLRVHLVCFLLVRYHQLVKETRQSLD